MSIDEGCGSGCGYVSSGRDLLEHMKHEHVRCPDCGRAPVSEDAAVSHKPDCPRLRPGYAYPPLDGGSDMGEPEETAPAAAGEKETGDEH